MTLSKDRIQNKSLIFLLLTCLFAVNAQAQVGPRPGDIYREYAVNLKSGDNWRVTDPNAGAAGAAEFLPNPVLSIQIDDLDKAIRAEVLMDIWGGHPGTSGKKFRFNMNDWIDIPRVPTLVISSPCFMKEYNVILDLPLEYLHEGENTFQGTSGGQVCGNFNWGQWGWYVMIVRVYYQPDKAHIEGQISLPLSGSSITDDPAIRVETEDPGSVSSIQILGHYLGYDENGDGIYSDWHRAYHGDKISGHVGTIEKEPFQLTWNTRYISDQKTAGLSFLARIKDTSGVWFVSDIVDSISLQRPDSLSVLMHRPNHVPENFWVRAGNTKRCYIDINPPGQAMEAVLYHRTWNAGDDEVAVGSWAKGLEVNRHSYKCYGKNHFFALSGVQLATGDLIKGDNTIAYRSNTQHHGMEILWPGPSIMVRYVIGGDTVANPTFSPPDGHSFLGILNPSIINQSEGSKIYYTTNGSDPNPSDERYRGQILRVESDITFKARAFKKDLYESEVVTARYTLDRTGIGQSRTNILSSHPNPVQGSLFLDLPPEFENGEYSIMDVNGRIVSTGSTHLNAINTEQLDNGIYFLNYESRQKIFIAKFVVQR